jgi:hypothetical protein
MDGWILVTTLQRLLGVKLRRTGTTEALPVVPLTAEILADKPAQPVSATTGH